MSIVVVVAPGLALEYFPGYIVSGVTAGDAVYAESGVGFDDSGDAGRFGDDENFENTESL